MTWQNELARAVGPIRRTTPVSGGDINDAFRVELATGRMVFVKTHADPPPGMYEAEAAGLAWLRVGPLRVPEVVAVADRFLALEWLDLDARGHGDAPDEDLGRGLAALHRVDPGVFGLPGRSFLGTIELDNTPSPDIATLWVERRLRPLVARLGGARSKLEAKLDRLRARPERFGPPEPAARLHGDLWWGNVVICRGAPVLIDPAAYGGHREIDLAMLQLFGSVSDRLVAAYEEVWPLAPGWHDRVLLWQLVPIAAHAVMFGGGYVAQLVAGLDRLA